MEILYQDRDIVVAIKPPNLVSEQTENGDGFADLLAKESQSSYIGVVHRLDRGVGGVMVYAKTPTAAAKLSAAVQKREFQKEYLAVIQGEPQESSATLQDLLFHDRIRNKTFVVDHTRKGVKEAVLSYQVTANGLHTEFGRISLLKIRLETGRTHQIRVQFASRGIPLLGDRKYGSQAHCEISLFCRSLSFPHPISGKLAVFETTPQGGVWNMFFEEIS